MTGLKDNNQRKTVLIVDDSLDDITFMSSILKDFYRIEAATNMEKALQIAFSEAPPDLILIDIMMPEKVGYNMCRYFKSIPETNDIPVIFLTS